jgi:mono/diheme cytochrome c family protein
VRAAALAAIALALAPAVADAQIPSRTESYQVVDSVVLPAGEAVAGRQAFQDLKCHVCHRVSGEKGFSPIAELQAPMLNATLQLQTGSDIAAAIIAPSHSVSIRTSEAVKAQMSRQGLSPMGDFSRALTVRQLADLLAYLRTVR